MDLLLYHPDTQHIIQLRSKIQNGTERFRTAPLGDRQLGGPNRNRTINFQGPGGDLAIPRRTTKAEDAAACAERLGGSLRMFLEAA